MNSAVKIARSVFTKNQIVENIMSSIEKIVDKIPRKWKNVQSIVLKTTNSTALPIYNSLPIDDAGAKVRASKLCYSIALLHEMRWVWLTFYVDWRFISCWCLEWTWNPIKQKAIKAQQSTAKNSTKNDASPAKEKATNGTTQTTTAKANGKASTKRAEPKTNKPQMKKTISSTAASTTPNKKKANNKNTNNGSSAKANNANNKKTNNKDNKKPDKSSPKTKPSPNSKHPIDNVNTRKLSKKATKAAFRVANALAKLS